MPGESKNANKISNNILCKLWEVANARKLDIYTHEVRLMVQKGKIYRYPDLVIAPEADDTDTHAITQPVIIVEVLSDGTAAVDRGEKLKQYRKIDTLQHYLIIAQDEKAIDMYSRDNKRWILESFDEEVNIIPLKALGCDIAIDAIYQKVKFS